MALKRHIVIPDTQLKHGVRTSHLVPAARYVAEKEPDHLQLLGDWYDMPSLSAWDKAGSKSTEGRRVHLDRDAGYKGLELFFGEIDRLGVEVPTVWLTEGNHENRLDRWLESDPKLDGAINRKTFYGWQDFGIKAAPMGKPMHKDGVTYCHFFDLNANGHTTGGRNGQPTAAAQVRRVRGSSVAGHRQGYDIARLTHPYARHGERETFAVIAGSFYQHHEKYRGPTDGYERHGIVVINELNGKGQGDPMFVSMRYLMESYA